MRYLKHLPALLVAGLALAQTGGINVKSGTLDLTGITCIGCGSSGSSGATLFSTTGSTTVTAASATTLIGTVSGSTTIPANTFAAGSFFEIFAQGYYTSPLAARTLTINVNVGGSTRLTTGAVTVIASVTNGVWRLHCGITTRTAGAMGTQIGNCIFEMTGATLTPGEAPLQTSSTWTVDTTGTLVVDLTAAWDSTTGSPSITSSNVAAYIPGAPVSSVGGATGAVTASTVLDSISSTQGTILYRGASGWSALAPGTSGNFLQTQGAAANPQWAAAGGGSVSSGSYASLPGTCTTGSLYLFNNTVFDQALCTSTNTWTLFSGGVSVSAPPSTGWTNYNFGTSSTDFTNGNLLFTMQVSASGDLIRGQYRTSVPSRPFSIGVKWSANYNGGNANAALPIGFSDGTQVLTWDVGVHGNGTVWARAIVYWSNSSTGTVVGGAIDASVTTALGEAMVGSDPAKTWLKALNDGTNLAFLISPDNGQHYVTFYSEACTTRFASCAVASPFTGAFQNSTSSKQTVTSINAWIQGTS